ncbi:MAG: amino acid ABC transporter substrate-binding protein [Rhodothermales bacterium]|nr:amino acid ABC transporter substrate-binding protein [Rhodothermales bacterium]
MAKMAALLMLLVTVAALPASARQTSVPDNAQAQTLFDEALTSFDAGEYAEAAAQFSRVAEGFDLHSMTTAAALMEGKALYRAGAFQEAVQTLSRFEERFASSRFVTDARRARRLAANALEATANAPIDLGIILSLNPDEASASQELFNGLRLAVDAHNGMPGARPIRMVFRDIGQMGADGALRSAVDAGSATVFGALFSDQATVAAALAEELEVVFIAPLATDEQVTDERTLAFQANPSIQMRGRLMARFAVNGLRLRDLGVVTEGEANGISRLMGAAFAQEAESLGARVRFAEVLPGPRAWLNIENHLSADSLRAVSGLYAPLAGAASDQLAGGFLGGLRNLLTPDEQRSLRVLGNSEWHDLPLREDASRFMVTYSNDYFFDRSTDRAQAFTRRFRNLSGVSPGRLGVVGYDLGTYLSEHLTSSDPQEVRARLLSAAPFQGLGVRVYFGGEQVNRQMFYHRYRDGQLSLMR